RAQEGPGGLGHRGHPLRQREGRPGQPEDRFGDLRPAAGRRRRLRCRRRPGPGGAGRCRRRDRRRGQRQARRERLTGGRTLRGKEAQRMALPENGNGEKGEGPVIRDKRRIDPETGELRTPEGEEAPQAVTEEEAGEQEPVIDAEAVAAVEADVRVSELTEDLKRVQAEYANYRKRVERDRQAVKEQALAQVLGELLPILDDIGRAREHDELTGGFKSVGESLEALVSRLGLKKYADKGDEFDPNVHEALTLVPQPGVEVPT